MKNVYDTFQPDRMTIFDDDEQIINKECFWFLHIKCIINKKKVSIYFFIKNTP